MISISYEAMARIQRGIKWCLEIFPKLNEPRSIIAYIPSSHHSLLVHYHRNHSKLSSLFFPPTHSRVSNSWVWFSHNSLYPLTIKTRDLTRRFQFTVDGASRDTQLTTQRKKFNMVSILQAFYMLLMLAVSSAGRNHYYQLCVWCT